MLCGKQILRQMTASKVFLVLIFLLTVFLSLSFFFVRFSIDGNAERIAEIAAKGGDLERYQTALSSNTTLSIALIPPLICLVALVLVIYFYRFFRYGQRQMGCLKALGYRDSYLAGIFGAVTAGFSLIGGMLGLFLAYPLSNVLIRANEEAYGVSGLVKALNISTVLAGIGIPIGIFTLTAWFCYGWIRGKEPGSLIAGNQNTASYGLGLRIANRIAEFLPVKNKLPIRLALRKLVALLLMFIAVMSFGVCMILAYSLNISSGKVFLSQTEGHNYEYVTEYGELLSESEALPDARITMLKEEGDILFKNKSIPQKVAGIYEFQSLYELMGTEGAILAQLEAGEAIIGMGLKEVYGIAQGDILELNIEGKTMKVTVCDIAANAQSNTLFVEGAFLADSLGVPKGSFNTVLSNEMPKISKGNTISKDERIELLKKDAVSNKVSGVINQVIGVLIGGILLFLALYMNFQDNTRDMLILHMLGYSGREIRRMLMDVYRWVLYFFFLTALIPGVCLVKAIQRNLSVSTGDYMPFGTNLYVIAFTGLFLFLIYQLVQWIFGSMIVRIIKKEKITEYTNGE